MKIIFMTEYFHNILKVLKRLVSWKVKNNIISNFPIKDNNSGLNSMNINIDELSSAQKLV